MIQAVLGSKSFGCEYKEDILTSTIFGTIKYLRPDVVLIPFIESAFLYDENRTTLWQKLNSEGIELRCYRKVEYIFWARNQNYGEPDLILLFSSHIHGDDDFLLIVEVKFKSGKSGTDENDQLARYFEAINMDIESFAESNVSSFRGKKGYMVYLTESEAYSDISASTQIIQNKCSGIKENVFHLRWHQLYKTLEKIPSFYLMHEKMIIEDLMLYMEKVGLRDFAGISLPDESLSSVFISSDPVFYEDVMNNRKKRTYFDQLSEVDFKTNNNIFYGGK